MRAGNFWAPSREFLYPEQGAVVAGREFIGKPSSDAAFDALLFQSCPDLFRASTNCDVAPLRVDGRVKPGHDGEGVYVIIKCPGARRCARPATAPARSVLPERQSAALSAVRELTCRRSSHDHPTLPSRLTASSFCASTANSIGNSFSTSLQKPLTISDNASSSDRPRWRQ